MVELLKTDRSSWEKINLHDYNPEQEFPDLSLLSNKEEFLRYEVRD